MFASNRQQCTNISAKHLITAPNNEKYLSFNRKDPKLPKLYALFIFAGLKSSEFIEKSASTGKNKPLVNHKPQGV